MEATIYIKENTTESNKPQLIENINGFQGELTDTIH